MPKSAERFSSGQWRMDVDGAAGSREDRQLFIEKCIDAVEWSLEKLRATIAENKDILVKDEQSARELQHLLAQLQADREALISEKTRH
jgi:hypothetical protein